MTLFSKILISNRGEIACRVIKTARRMGIATVAVYSEADAHARHVRLADEAVAIGPAAARESYLVGAHILDAARRTGAQAIHPGYGFLSENEDFAEACERAGIVFIGPPASAIRAMGLKSAAKTLMAKAGVPLTPGYHGDQQDPDFLAAQAEQIGYPVLIKASAGGGGKGMRRVDASADFAAALASCRREAAAAFGNDTVLVEKYVLRPRHIEIQVFGDRYGDCVYLFERDCSVQRRHQKVLEEAPAPGMTAERRAAMGRAAVDAAKAVGYVGAGTVEFIANQDGSFYFMEMNTRLQVEHPVTEMITGLDLVEWQLRVAAGEPLPLTQQQIRLDGHAIEARIYAEDPDKGFLPSTGKLIHLAPPLPSAYVRIDTGVEQGDEITPFYDPMIAKLIVWDHDRNRALARLRQALADYRVAGVANNIEFLGRLASSPAFTTADLDTGLIEREHEFLFPAAMPVPEPVWQLVALDELLTEMKTAAASKPAPSASGDVGHSSGRADVAPLASPWDAFDGWRLNGKGWRELAFRHGETERTLMASRVNDGWELQCDGHLVSVNGELHANGALRARIDDHTVQATVIAVGERRYVFFEGRSYILARIDPLHTLREDEEANGSLRAPMPGKVVALLVENGTAVEKNTPLLVIEAMKMEHTITAPAKGTVKAFHCAPGEQVDEGFDLVEFESEAEVSPTK